MRNPLYFVKQTGSTSTWTVQNSLDNADTYMPLTQDYPLSLIDSTGHCNSNDKHSISLCFAFLATVHQITVLDFVVLNSTTMHCHIYYQKPLYILDTQ